MLSKPTEGLRRNVNGCLPLVAHADEAPLGEQGSLSATQFKPGRLVRICRGAFAGVEGAVILRVGKSRLIVALAVSQSGVYLEVDAEMLQAID